MDLRGIVIFGVLIVALCVAFRGLVSERRSTVGGVIAAGIALLSALISWYSWAETGSVSWTVGYGVVALLGCVSAGRQFRRG